MLPSERLAIAARLHVLLRLTTRICHVKGVVVTGEREERPVKGFQKNPARMVMTPMTAGRRIPLMLAREEQLRAFAEVTDLKGLSGHADVNELMRWMSEVPTPPRPVFVPHGEEDAALALCARIAEERGFATHAPRHVERVMLD